MAHSTDPDPAGTSGADAGGAARESAASPFAPDADGYPQDPYAALPPGAPEDAHAAAVAAALAQQSARNEPEAPPAWAQREPLDPKKYRGLMVGAFAAGIGVTMALLVVVGLVIALATGALNTTASPTEDGQVAPEASGKAGLLALRMPDDVDGWRPQTADAEVYAYVKGDSPRRIMVAPQGTQTTLQSWVDTFEGERSTSADGRVTCGTATGDPMCVLETEAAGVVTLTTLSDGVDASEILAIGDAIAAANP